MFQHSYTETVNIGKLYSELTTDLLAKYSHMLINGNGVDIFFNPDIDASEKTNLDAIVLAHDPVRKKYKLYNHITHTGGLNEYESPYEINYKTGLNRRLHPDYVFIQGELQEVTFYENTNPFSVPVLKVTFSYTRDVVGFATTRTKIIEWYFDDGTLSPDSKTMVKYYTNAQAIEEGKRRRGNIIDQMQLPIVGLMVQFSGLSQTDAILQGRLLFSTYQNNINAFIGISDKAIIDDIQNDATFAWLDDIIDGNTQTIRDYIADQLTIPGSIS